MTKVECLELTDVMFSMIMTILLATDCMLALTNSFIST